jgi:hypothetical protein
MLYEVRGRDQGKIYRVVLSVLDRLNLRLNVVDKDSAADLERLTFALTTDRRHTEMRTTLRQSDQTDEVIAFRDEEEE